MKNFSITFFAFIALASTSLANNSLDNMIGTYKGKTPSFLGLNSKPCNLVIEKNMTMVNNENRDTIKVTISADNKTITAQSELWNDNYLSDRRVSYRHQEGDAMIGNFIDVSFKLDNNGIPTCAKLYQQDQALIFLPLTKVEITCKNLVRD